MGRFAIQRTRMTLPTEQQLEGARALLFGALDGFGKDDKASWRRFWKKMIGMQPGEIIEVDMVFPRSGPFHRRHMALEQSIFDAQEAFGEFEMLRTWLKIGAGWVIWAPGPDGQLVPIPKSISYAAADQDEFQKFHEAVVRFLRTDRAAGALWPHLGRRAGDMMTAILRGFDEL